eukprot:1148579-Pelagomonas_calceolata.AAC.5
MNCLFYFSSQPPKSLRFAQCMKAISRMSMLQSKRGQDLTVPSNPLKRPNRIPTWFPDMRLHEIELMIKPVAYPHTFKPWHWVQVGLEPAALMSAWGPFSTPALRKVPNPGLFATYVKKGRNQPAACVRALQVSGIQLCSSRQLVLTRQRELTQSVHSLKGS